MFEQLFEGTQALAHQRAGPLLEERLRYLNHLASQAMSWHYLRHTAHYLLAVATCLRLADRPNDPIRLTEIELQRRKRGQVSFSAGFSLAFLGRPWGRIDDCRPSASAVCSCQCVSP